MKLGLYGGSFDPIHNGHLEPVRAAALELDLERVIYLPTAYPPHKRDRELASPRLRWLMCELAVLDDPTFEVSTHELIDRPSYTIETVEHFRRRHPDAELHLLIGEDSFRQLESWRRWRELSEVVRLVVLSRSEADAADAGPAVPADRVVFLSNPVVPWSSRQIREELARGGSPPPGSLPARVLQYVQKYRLYR